MRSCGVLLIAMTFTRRLIALPVALCSVLVLLAAAAAQGSSSTPTVAAGATGASGATGPGVPGTPLQASLSACHTDVAPANRYAIFASQMIASAARGTVDMSVEFVLEERGGAGGGFQVVPAPGFGTWVASQRGVGIFTYSHEVTALPAPASFRVLVHARWIGRAHRVLRRIEALSPACVQPLLQPNLQVGAIFRGAAQSTTAVTWNVAVRNVGSAPAGQFQVSLSVGGSTLTAVTVPGLAAGASQVVQFTGPRCAAGGSLVATADSTNALSEPTNPDRTRTVGCVA